MCEWPAATDVCRFPMRELPGAVVPNSPGEYPGGICTDLLVACYVSFVRALVPDADGT